MTIEEAQAALQFSACDVHKSMAEFGLFAEVYVQSQIDDAIFHRIEEAHAVAVRRAWPRERFCNSTDTAWKTTRWREDKQSTVATVCELCLVPKQIERRLLYPNQMDKPSARKIHAGDHAKPEQTFWQARTPRKCTYTSPLSIHPVRIKSDAPLHSVLVAARLMERWSIIEGLRVIDPTHILPFPSITLRSIIPLVAAVRHWEDAGWKQNVSTMDSRRAKQEVKLGVVGPCQTHFAYSSARQDRRVKGRITVHEGKLCGMGISITQREEKKSRGTGQGVMCKGRENGGKTNTDSVTRLGYAKRSDRETRWTPGPESIRIMGGQRVPHVDTNDGVDLGSRKKTHRYLCMRERRLGRSAAAPRTPACMGARRHDGAAGSGPSAHREMRGEVAGGDVVKPGEI
ncbi:hypothetical protein B0H13DRAFT_1860608 [Mycena leptocephala]|nr:hypothetical protein B0H13DRAFT_1860608 [Mycena leptocephala]